MRFHFEHLLRSLKMSPSKRELSEVLFQLGHENEYSDEIFDLELTPNRGDCLSLQGLARDLNYFFGCKQDLKIFDGEIDHLEIKFKNNEPLLCPNINFLYIEIESSIKDYKSYLRSYFDELDNKRVNFFTDVSNYVSYELGQPSHCYNYESLKGEIVLKKADKKKDFKTLIGEQIEVQKGDLVFSINDEIINLAGLMGGQKTKCKSDTNKVLIEFAHFRPDDILGKSSKYGLNSEAAYKFERFVDPKLLNLAMKRFIKIVEEHVSIKKVKYVQASRGEKPNRMVKFDLSKINNILGTNYNKESITRILSSLSFQVHNDEIIVPSFRSDVININDISEEVARVVGYNNIPSQKINLPKINKKLSSVNYLRKFLNKNGFTEVVNFQFSNIEDDDNIVIDNPLDINKKTIRTSLKMSLIENLLYNERRQKESIKLFEISDIYKTDKDGNIVYEKYLALIASGRVGNNYKEFTKKIDVSFVKEIFHNLKFDVDTYLTKIQRESLETKRKDEIFFIEIPFKEVEALIDSSEIIEIDSNILNQRYKDISDFPSSNRDFSFLVNDTDTIKLISQKILDFKSKILKDVFLFDFYEDRSRQKVKAAFRFIFQGVSKTLTEEEINQDLEPLLNDILSLKDVSIPGFKNDTV